MIQVFDDLPALNQAAAELFVKTSIEAVQERGRFTVALTGGSSPLQLYQLLSQSPYREQIPWSQTHVFWGDERWVPLNDDRSNAKMAFEIFLDKVPVPKDQVYPMWADQQPEEFALHYEKLLREYFQETDQTFDMVLLGMGDDAHTASLFPGTEVLKEQERWVQAYYLAPQEMYRITLTAPILNKARQIVFLTFGEKKADALKKVLEGDFNPEKYPAQLIRPQKGKVLWLTDKAASRRLSEREKGS